MRQAGALKKTVYDWQDYRSWNDGQKWEIIAGEAFAMTPAPSPRHQTILGNLYACFRRQFKGKPCQVFLAPTDVRLSDHDIVQPDLLVVCDPRQIKPTHIEGAPTLVLEILSPASAVYDRARKVALYARHGVKEVWLVTPYPSLAEVLVLDDDAYRLAGTFTRESRIASPTFPGFAVSLRKVFDFPLEPGEEIAMVKEGRPPYGKKGSVLRSP